MRLEVCLDTYISFRSVVSSCWFGETSTSEKIVTDKEALQTSLLESDLRKDAEVGVCRAALPFPASEFNCFAHILSIRYSS